MNSSRVHILKEPWEMIFETYSMSSKLRSTQNSFANGKRTHMTTIQEDLIELESETQREGMEHGKN